MALITPAVTEGSELPSRKPYGLPMAMAHSPMRRSRDPPSGAVGRLRASILSTARSFISSIPRTLAGYVVPSRRATLTLDAPATTCALVTITPLGWVMKPDPMPDRVCVPPSRFPKKNANGSTGVRKTVSVCTVTTAGATRATASVMADRRDAAIWTLASRRAATPCAAVRDGEAPSHASKRAKHNGERRVMVIGGGGAWDDG